MMKILIGIIIVIILTFIYCCMKVSSDKSRWEEIEQENESREKE